MIGIPLARVLGAVSIAVAFLSRTAAAFPVNTCATIAPPQNALNVSTTALTVDHHPFGIAYYTNDIALVVIRRSIAVLDVSHFTPVIKYQINLPPDVLAHLGLSEDDPDTDDYIFHGLALSPDKKNFYAAGGYGALILDAERAVAGRNDSIVGVLANDGRAGNYSAMISITPDNQYVFLTQEFGSLITGNRGDLEVWKVTRSPNGTVSGAYKGFLVLGYATVDTAFSQDYSKLYVTSEVRAGHGALNLTEGSIAVLDVETLKTNPSAAFLWDVPAGCHPVRIKLGTDGKHVYTNTREANQLLVFDADKLNSNETASDAFVTAIQVGTSPVSLVIVGDYILTADSNRFGYSNTTTGLSVINAVGTLGEGQLSTYPQIPMGPFPREFGLSPDQKTLLVSEFDGYAIRAVDLSFLKQHTSVNLGQRTMKYQGPRHYI